MLLGKKLEIVHAKRNLCPIILIVKTQGRLWVIVLNSCPGRQSERRRQTEV